MKTLSWNSGVLQIEHPICGRARSQSAHRSTAKLRKSVFKRFVIWERSPPVMFQNLKIYLWGIQTLVSMLHYGIICSARFHRRAPSLIKSLVLTFFLTKLVKICCMICIYKNETIGNLSFQQRGCKDGQGVLGALIKEFLCQHCWLYHSLFSHHRVMWYLPRRYLKSEPKHERWDTWDWWDSSSGYGYWSRDRRDLFKQNLLNVSFHLKFHFNTTLCSKYNLP